MYKKKGSSMIAIQKSQQSVYILHPDKVEACEQAGGKAAALASLHKAGLPIPPWFVISPAAFIASLPAEQRIAFAEACVRSDNTTIQTILATVQIADHICKELEQAIATLCIHGEYVAVRSSALEEDGARHSFAGQLDTFLFVPPRQIMQTILAVWRSGFSERMLAYRREHSLNMSLEPPAVIVQLMIDADVSGVAFSADPVTGQRGIAIVSALYGLGTALVSGECDADTYTVERNGAILTRTLANKTIAHRHGDSIANETEAPLEGVHPVPVPPELASHAALKDEQIHEVVKLVRRCEQHFSFPQDIEWGIFKGQLFLLQSRPITALASMADPDGQYALWDNSNIAESYNGVTTPLTFSFARFAYEQVYRQMCRVLGTAEAAILQHDDTFRHMIGLIQGRVYYNLLNWYRLLALMPGFRTNRRFMEQMMGVKEGLPESIVAEMGQSTWKGRLRDQFRLIASCIVLLVRYYRLPHSIDQFYQRIDHALATPRPDLDQMRPDELVTLYRSLESQLITHWDAPLVNDLFAMIFYGTLRALSVKWCGDVNGSLQNDLLSGEGGIISAEPARCVHAMAILASYHPAFVDLLCSGSQHEIQTAMETIPTFAAEYQSYLDTFADRCLEELKLESPTLLDDPLPLLRSIGQLARRIVTSSTPSSASDTAGRAGTSALQKTPRQSAEESVARVLRHHPLRRLLFGWVLKQARMRVRDRENLRFERTRVFGRVRRLFSELGRRFHALDLLKEPQDIFYLEVEEALGFVTGRATTTDLCGLVSVRKAEYARFKLLTDV
ncbi:MAG: hypothetical protein JO215_05210, partial [Ktedonobacteraceae bacterium]|nr:hypothetical protein [Ktedonobacteraceae bacterium]